MNTPALPCAKIQVLRDEKPVRETLAYKTDVLNRFVEDPFAHLLTEFKLHLLICIKILYIIFGTSRTTRNSFIFQVNFNLFTSDRNKIWTTGILGIFDTYVRHYKLLTIKKN